MIRPVEERRRNAVIAGLTTSAATGALLNGGMNYLQQRDFINNIKNGIDTYTEALKTAGWREKKGIQTAIDTLKGTLGDARVDKTLLLKAAGAGAALMAAAYVLFNGIGYLVSKAFAPKQKYLLVNAKDLQRAQQAQQAATDETE